ncbi:hypothetical protein FAM09_26565 [Niastella caeni]|uniref:Uncharacterized protein n=1 Tax=Niastella caeni TaxID=2569763 RepID=A0A4S8HDA2_9BACT|nr:PD-(D/E)XK nuclease domain-containing protein [Niastella caeni]THU33010.1 hypothetical protein FAM09_26565 [Niastella caeni]
MVRQFARTPLFEDKDLTMWGKGIELNIGALHSIWYELNALAQWDESKMSKHRTAIEFTRFKLQGQLIAVVKFFLFDCNEMIFLSMKHDIQIQLQKMDLQLEKGAYLLKAQKGILLQKDQLWESVFMRLIEFLDIELAHFRALKEHERVDATNELICTFLADSNSRISSGRLLGFLLTDQIDCFCADLKEFAMRVLSTHDVGGKDPEKVYHLFLVGIFSAFAHQYELSSNREVGLGRFDICLRPYILGNKGLIFEVKRANSNKEPVVKQLLQSALEQVQIKKYSYELKGGGAQEFTAIAAVFFGKELFFKYAVVPIP